MQWRKVMTADYNKFHLTVIDEYKAMNPNEFVYNHKGELLYFYTYNPADVPVFQYTNLLDLDEVRANNKNYGIHWDYHNHVNYRMDGADCGGVPTFSHWTAEYIAENIKSIEPFEPLTVAAVTKWFGWFLYQLNNSYLIIGKQ
jgi:hypothetical protein